jgi:hypothetical protein
MAFAQSKPTVASGWIHTVGLKKDGSVIATGLASPPMCDVGAWSGISQIAAGHYHTVALKSNGSVVATGSNSYGECNVGSWSNIMALAPLSYSEFTVGLKTDHSVIATGRNDYGQCDVSSWTDVDAVAAGFIHTLGLKSNGTVVAAGSDFYHESDVGSWTGIKAVGAGWYHSLGIKQDGSVVATGMADAGQCDVSGWRDIVAVAGGYWHSVGLKKDGTVVATVITGPGTNYGQSDVSGWRDIVAISTSGFTTVGLKSDGTVVATGLNSQHQTDVSSWHLADPDDNIPGVAATTWPFTGYGSIVTDKYDVWPVNLIKDVPVTLSCARTSGNANFDIFLYPPGANDIWRFDQWLPGWQWSKSGDQTETINYTPTQTGTHYLLVDAGSGAGNYRVTEKCASVLSASSASGVVYGQALHVAGRLSSVESYAPIAGAQLTLERDMGAGWSPAATSTVGPSGAFDFAFTPSTKGAWRVSLVATDPLTPCSASGSFGIIAKLATPKVSGRIRAGRTLTFTGTIDPHHKAKIKIAVYRLKNHKLKAYKTYSVYSKSSGTWSLKLKLGKGDWRIRAGHVDADHAQGWSGYKRVKIAS